MPFVTDLADHPPHFWIECHPKQHVVCGTPRAVQQARAIAHPAQPIHATWGMVLRPEFYPPARWDKAARQHQPVPGPCRKSATTPDGFWKTNSVWSPKQALPELHPTDALGCVRLRTMEVRHTTYAE